MEHRLIENIQIEERERKEDGKDRGENKGHSGMSGAKATFEETITYFQAWIKTRITCKHVVVKLLKSKGEGKSLKSIRAKNKQTKKPNLHYL